MLEHGLPNDEKAQYRLREQSTLFFLLIHGVVKKSNIGDTVNNLCCSGMFKLTQLRNIFSIKTHRRERMYLMKTGTGKSFTFACILFSQVHFMGFLHCL